jgi:hypothetical protein
MASPPALCTYVVDELDSFLQIVRHLMRASATPPLCKPAPNSNTGDSGYVGQDGITYDRIAFATLATAHRVPSEEDASSVNPIPRLLSIQG